MSACDLEEDEERSFTIDKVHIDAKIEDTGVIHVQEQYTYTFSGEFNGTTRSIRSNVADFKAYFVGENQLQSLPSIDNLEALPTEKDNELEVYKIYTNSENETKTFLYEYNIHESIDKYEDIGKLEYAFFDATNESDLHDITIAIHSPKNKISNDTHFFLREDGNGEITTSSDGILYKNRLLKAGEDSYITFLFPATELSAMKITKNKPMLETILNAEAEWASREKNLETNFTKITPIIITMLIVVILIAIFMFIIHPIRYRGIKVTEDLIQVLEGTDPLFISYLKNNNKLKHESIIAALFSLKKRRIIQIEEVSSQLEEGETTYRFTWIKDRAKVDMADGYLREWLFTRKSEQGNYFLLEDIMDNPDEPKMIREEKGKEFDGHISLWKGLVLQEQDYQHVRHHYRGFDFMSLLYVLMCTGLFYYFITVDMITQGEQLGLKIILVALTLISLFLSRYKIALALYYILIIMLSLIFFSLFGASILAVIFYIVTFIINLMIPSYYWTEDVKQIKFAMNVADNLMYKNRYPVGSNIETIENRLMYAILLGMGTEYAEQCGKEEFVKRFAEKNVLLRNPEFVAETFSTYNIAFYSGIGQSTTSVGASTSFNSSSTGGGGAGAF